MATIARATKSGSGTGDYSTGTILANEVNTDFNTLYNEVNGSLNADNLATDAVTTAKITDANVTTAKIADLGVTTGKLAALAVTTAKIAVGNAVRGVQTANVTTSVSVTNSATETDLVTLASFTSGGGWITIGGQWGLMVTPVALTTAYYRLILYRDTTVVQRIDYRYENAGATVDQAVPMPFFHIQPGAGSYVFKITCQIVTVGATIGHFYTPSANAGSMFASETA